MGSNTTPDNSQYEDSQYQLPSSDKAAINVPASTAETNKPNGVSSDGIKPTKKSLDSPVANAKTQSSPSTATNGKDIETEENLTTHFSPDDHVYFDNRGIDLAEAWRHGVRRMGHHELFVELGFRAGKEQLSGIVFPTRNPLTEENTSGILRPDENVGSESKYLRSKEHGQSTRARTVFFSADATKGKLETIRTPLYICESPAKAIALQSILEDGGITIGLNGVNGAWHRPQEMVAAKNGGLRPVKKHAILNEDLLSVNWHNRRVWVVFDNDVNTHKHANKFKEKQGVIWAEMNLVDLLRKKGAFVEMTNFPYKGEVLGVDDFIVKSSPARVRKHLYEETITHRDVKDLLRRPEGRKLIVRNTANIKKEPLRMFVKPGLVCRGKTTIFAGPQKIGKSTMVLNMMQSFHTGDPWLGRFEVEQGLKSLYLSYEMTGSDTKEMAEDLGIEVDIVDTVEDYPEGFALNAIKPGYKSHEEIPQHAGNLVTLEEQIQDEKVDVLFIDHAVASIDQSVNDELVVRRFLFDIAQMARRTGHATVIIHHTRKSHDNDTDITETIHGTANWIRMPDSLITSRRVRAGKHDTEALYRYRMEFQLRYAPEIHPMEVFREKGYLLRVEPWKKEGKSASEMRADKIASTFHGRDDLSPAEVMAEFPDWPRNGVTNAFKTLLLTQRASESGRGQYRIH